MHVTCVAMSLDKLEPERAHGKLSHNMAAVFVNTKTHFGLKQIIVLSFIDATIKTKRIPSLKKINESQDILCFLTVLKFRNRFQNNRIRNRFGIEKRTRYEILKIQGIKKHMTCDGSRRGPDLVRMVAAIETNVQKKRRDLIVGNSYVLWRFVIQKVPCARCS